MSMEPSPLGDSRADRPDTAGLVLLTPSSGNKLPSNQTGRFLLGGASLPEFQGEVRSLLYHRLREAALLGSGGWVLILALCLSGVDQLFRVEKLGWACIGTVGTTVAAFLVWVAILFLRPGASLITLRVCEGFLAWLSAASMGFLRWGGLNHALDQLGYNPNAALLAAYATAFTDVLWFALIAIYGVFIPNTWQRAWRMTFGLVAVMLTIDLVSWVPRFPFALEAFWSPLFLTLYMLFLGLGTALYGSFKIGSLQQEALAARQEVRALGQYRLKKLLGSGVMGEVYLAEHQFLKRPCALKVIRPERAGDPQTLTRFEREVQATALLNHPNIVEIFDYGRTDEGTFYYVMEFLDGLSLHDLVRQHGRLSPGRAVYLLRQLCSALRQAHAKGMIHRDIKPSNVLVCRLGGVCDVVKLVDFGLVQTGLESDSHLTQEGHLVGTPDYMSPEQADNPKTIDGRSDLYSLGGVLYFMLTGQPPFTGKRILELLLAHRQEPVPPLSTHGIEAPVLEPVVQRCLAKQPGERYPDAESLGRELQAIAAELPWSEDQALHWWKQEGPVSEFV